ncbi:MAG: right-handed parallel beta-helix repeat-containing protein, partial [Flavobacteriales bacterium]|nr:right-handed parallel beta-helix repeat-containing protein [Flavobacteriales bacterium]
KGISGNVIISVADGTYNEQLVIPGIWGTNAAAGITFQSASGDSTGVILTFSSFSSTANYTVKFDGAQYITFKQITIKATGVTYARCVEFSGPENNSGPANNIILTNNVIESKLVTSTSDNYAAVYANGYYYSNSILNNHIINGSYSIYLTGISCRHSTSTLISGNDIDGYYYMGVYLIYQEAPQFLSNTVHTTSALTTSIGVYLNVCSGVYQVKKNKLYGSYQYGIYLFNSDGTSGSEGEVYNNMIESGSGSSNNSYGFYLSGCDYVNLYHNSVNVTCVQTSGGRGLYTTTGSNIRLVNNIFANTGSGYAIYINTTAAIIQSDYNNLYSTGCNIGYWAGARTDLAAWQAASSRDANSVSDGPQYFSSIDLHTGNIGLANAGTNLSAVIPDDYDGAARPATPYIGADEFGAPVGGLSGTYTIPGNYATFTAAINDLVAKGITANVVFNVADGTYNEQVIVPGIRGVTSSAGITFQSATGDATAVILTFASSGSAANYTVKLDGAKYITFKQMTIKATGATYGRCVAFSGLANNNTLTNNVIESPSVSSSSADYYVLYSTNDDNYSNNILNNIIKNGSYGIYFGGTSCIKPSGTLISGNDIDGFYDVGCYLTYQDAPQFISNTVHTTSTLTTSEGVYLNYCSGAYQVHKNNIYGTYGHGIYLVSSDGTSGNEAEVYNNMSEVGEGTSTTSYGIYLSGCDYVNIYFNSVGVSSTHATGGRGLYTTGGSNIKVVNNIFSNTGGGYAIYINTTAAIVQCDYNDLYFTGTNLGYWSGAKTTLAAWQTATSQDANSVSTDPMFVSASDLHIQSSSPCVDGAIVLAAVPNDIEGELRNPDMGADEFFAPLPIELVTFSGENHGNYNLLEWLTNSETNNEYFTLERAMPVDLEKLEWEEVGQVDGAGNSNTLLHYQFLDDTYRISPLQSRIFYYRLKQTDFDGHFEYSNIIALTVNIPTPAFVEKLYPNPATKLFTFYYTGESDIQPLVMTLFNSVGQVVLQHEFAFVIPYTKYKVNMPNLANGIYHVQFKQSGKNTVHKLVIAK